MEKLYAEYGQLMVQAEIIQFKIDDVKKRINQGIMESQSGEKPKEKDKK